MQTPLNTIDFMKFENEKENYIKQRQQDIAKEIQNNFVFGKMLIV